MKMDSPKNQITRHLDRDITTSYPILPNSVKTKRVNALVDFSSYCQMLYDALSFVKSNVKQQFDKASVMPIDDYLELLNLYYNDFSSYVYNSHIVDRIKASTTNKEWEKYARFFKIAHSENLNDNISSSFGESIFLNDFSYEKLKSLTNHVFTLELLASQALKKAQKPKIKGFDPFAFDKNNFNFFVRVIVPSDWRKEEQNDDISHYFANKLAMSTSLVSNVFSVIFTCGTCYQNYPIYGYVYDPKSTIIACGKYDAMFEESINNKSPLKKSAIVHSAIDRVAILNDGKNSHEIYADALIYLWPEYTFNNAFLCNEYILSSKEKPVAYFYCNKSGKLAIDNIKRQRKDDLPVIELPIKVLDSEMSF